MIKRVAGIPGDPGFFPLFCPGRDFWVLGIWWGRGGEHGRIRAHLGRDVRLRADVSTADDLPYMEGCQGT